jgi:hypothetical protein
MLGTYRWEYSPLARCGDFAWFRLVDPLLRFVANDELTFLRRARGFIQILLLIAILLLPISVFYNTAHMVLASGLLFDVAGILRLFLFEEIRAALNGFRDRESLPSVAMHELAMPEDTWYGDNASETSMFYYRKRGVLYLFVGFLLQLLSSFL